MLKVKVEATIRIADLLQYLREKRNETYYLCYNIAQMIGDKIEKDPGFKEYQIAIEAYHGTTPSHIHYGFLEFNDEDHELSLQVVGQINSFLYRIGQGIDLNATYFSDDCLNRFQSDSVKGLSRTDPYGIDGFYRVWGRDTRMNILQQILELDQDAVIRINL